MSDTDTIARTDLFDRTPTWEPTASGGYQMLDAVLVKSGRRWSLRWQGHVVDLGRRASFDHAEGELVRLGWSDRDFAA